MGNFFARQAATEQRLLKRSCESLLGVCAGLLADDHLSDDEIRYLELWLKENDDIANSWPGDIVYARVREILSDGHISDSERAYLTETLNELIGGSTQETGSIGGASTSLPIDTVDTIEIPGRSFCFTGQFLFGTRAACHRAVEDRGGTAAPRVTKKLDFLVIGTMSSREWAHTSHGRKIEKAMAWQRGGAQLVILSEEQWVSFL